MAGGGMATVRAALMGLIAILARYLNRPAAALRALGVAVVAMLLYNPLVLSDVGFILSVLATFGLITLAPFVEHRLRSIPLPEVRAMAATTIAVQIFVLPALLYFTGVLSFVSVPLNIVVLPFIPLAMLFGFVAGILALLHPSLALLPGFLADTLLRGVITFAEVAAALPLASMVVPAFPAWLALLIYIPFTLFAMRVYARNVSPLQTN
jgi:competence protein ComEC